MSCRTDRSREARERALEQTYEIMKDALHVVNANGDTYSARTARQALHRVESRMRHCNA